MPLEKGSSKEAFDANVAELIKAGHSKEQALAIAYKVKRGENSEKFKVGKEKYGYGNR